MATGIITIDDRDYCLDDIPTHNWNNISITNNVNRSVYVVCPLYSCVDVSKVITANGITVHRLSDHVSPTQLVNMRYGLQDDELDFVIMGTRYSIPSLRALAPLLIDEFTVWFDDMVLIVRGPVARIREFYISPRKSEIITMEV